MPIYKLHEAPRVEPSFSNQHAANLPPVRVPLQSQVTPVPEPSSVPSSAAASTMSSPAANVVQGNSLPINPQSPPPSLETAHFGHSLYFIEHLFPSKLWRIIDDAERGGYDNIISWVDDGMAFQIHDRESIIPILEKYFSVSKYKSFLRQLQAYGFQRSLPNPEDDPCRDSKSKSNTTRGKWSHKWFRRDKMNLCNKMTRDSSKPKPEKDDESTPEKNITSKPAASPPLSPSHRINQSQAALVKHIQHQKELAAMGKQQQAQQQAQQQQLQFFRNRMLQQQHHHHQQQQQHQQHNLRQQIPGIHNGARFQPPFHPAQQQPQLPNRLPPGVAIARAQHQQKEEQHRQQLQMQINQIKERQMLSSILNGRGEVHGKSPSSMIGAPAPSPASQTMLSGVIYNKMPAPLPPAPSPATKGVSETVSEAANELRRAELTLAQRRWRLAEAQERAKKEAEALAQAEAAIARARGGPQSPSLVAKTTATAKELLKQTSPMGATKRPAPDPDDDSVAAKKRMLGKLPLTSLLEEIDNAFKSPSASSNKAQSKDQLKITEEELLRAKAEAAAKPMEQLLHASRPTPPAPAPGNVSAETSAIVARINAMEQMRLREQQQQQHPSGDQDLLVKIAMAERDEREQRQRMGTKVKPDTTSAAVRDALRNAGVGLISGDSLPSAGSNSGVTSTVNLSSTASVAQQGILSKEMMDIFAKTAAAAISSKKSDDGIGNSSQVTTAANFRKGSPPTSGPSSPLIKPTTAARLLPLAPKDVTPAAALSSEAIGSRPATQLLPGKTITPAPTIANPTSLPTSSSHVVSTSELDAARALMKIPGTVEQTSREPMMGHWELVRPEELRKGSSLAKALPEVVNKSSGLSYDAYKIMAQKLSPPKVMRIPDGWNATKEPVYLVVDPANAPSSDPILSSAKSAAPLGSSLAHK